MSVKQKIKTCGIVVEYNPFHNGHIYQIEQLKKQYDVDCVVVVMSGNFVQRGEPSIIDKWKRAECAVRNGVDVVIELPYIYATQSASQFAHGAITLLKLAEVDAICFGSECGNLENLMEIADTPIRPDHLHVAMDQGMSFPKAYSLLTSDMYPNDILAVAYLKELKDSNIKPIVIPRTNHYLSEDITEIASANAIRKAIKKNVSIMHSTPMHEVLENNAIFMDELYPYIRTLLLTTPKERLQDYFLFSEGIETHLQTHAKTCDTFTAFIKSATTYRYTSSRIKRTILQLANQVTWQEVKKLTPLDTLRILAFNERGRAWLRSKRDSDVKIASKFADVPYLYRTMEYRTTLLYGSLLNEEKRNALLQEEIQGAHYIKNKSD